MTTARRNVTSEDLKNEVLAKIKHYTEKRFVEAPRLHELFMEANPGLQPRLWYGMPGYAKSKDSAVLCFFRKDEFVTFGVTESSAIRQMAAEDGVSILPSSWFVTELNDEVEQQISNVVQRATE